MKNNKWYKWEVLLLLWVAYQLNQGDRQVFNVENYNEFGRQDESYYVVITGHEAKTFIGFRDDADIPQFFNSSGRTSFPYYLTINRITLMGRPAP